MKSQYPSDRKYEDIAPHIGRKAKLFFRIIVRKGMNRFMQLDDKKRVDLLDIGVHCVHIDDKKYFIVLETESFLHGHKIVREALILSISI